MRKFFVAAAVAAIALAGASNAEFFPGAPIAINGAAGPEFGGTTWGTWAGQGLHNLGGVSNYFDSIFGPAFAVIVSSDVINPNLLSIVLDFTTFAPGDFSLHSANFISLKNDGSIVGVSASAGVAFTDGNNIHWEASGAEVAGAGTIKLLIEQIPSPGALALLGVAGLAARRRRA